MVTIFFKRGICLDFPSENVKLHFFRRDENYRLETIRDGKEVSVYFSGDDVLYVVAQD